MYCDILRCTPLTYFQVNAWQQSSKIQYDAEWIQLYIRDGHVKQRCSALFDNYSKMAAPPQTHTHTHTHTNHTPHEHSFSCFSYHKVARFSAVRCSSIALVCRAALCIFQLLKQWQVTITCNSVVHAVHDSVVWDTFSALVKPLRSTHAFLSYSSFSCTNVSLAWQSLHFTPFLFIFLKEFHTEHFDGSLHVSAVMICSMYWLSQHCCNCLHYTDLVENAVLLHTFYW